LLITEVVETEEVVDLCVDEFEEVFEVVEVTEGEEELDFELKQTPSLQPLEQEYSLLTRLFELSQEYSINLEELEQ
jgi:hypothetical protein